MKRIGFLFEKITELDNIKLAIANAARRKKKRGKVKKVLENVDLYAAKIKYMLESDSYKFSQPLERDICERGKVRHIKVPKFYPDQIIHWSLMQIITPIMNRGMYRYCCGSVKGKGGSFARKEIARRNKPRQKWKYVLKADIRHFFQSVDTAVLKADFRRIIKDKKVLKLIDEILDNGGSMGIPIGYYPSQGASNFYLLGFDHFIKEKLHIRFYVRYVDDVVLMDTNKRKLHKARLAMSAFLGKIKLCLKGDWQIWRRHSRPIDFVGYRFYDGYTLLRKKIFYSLNRVVRKIQKFGITLMQARRFISYSGWAKFINFKNYYLIKIKPIISKQTAKSIISKRSIYGESV